MLSYVLMPTIYLRPRKRSYPFYYRVAERMALRNMSVFLMIFGLFDFVRTSARNAGRNLFRQYQVFNFLSFNHKLYLGGRNIDRLYMVASFMMNLYTTNYGSQFTAAMEEAGVDLHVTTNDLLMKAEEASARM